MQTTADNSEDYLFKILVIGDIGTGKTALIKRYVHNFFSSHYRSTIGVDFALKVVNWDDHTVIRLQLWDIAGQERFGNMTRVYYKEASGALVVFDKTRRATLDGVAKWKYDLDQKLQLINGLPIPAVLLANKCDLNLCECKIETGVLDNICKNLGFIGWFDTSAKENIGIHEAANCLLKKMLAIKRANQYEIPVKQMVDNSTNHQIKILNGSAKPQAENIKLKAKQSSCC